MPRCGIRFLCGFSVEDTVIEPSDQAPNSCAYAIFNEWSQKVLPREHSASDMGEACRYLSINDFPLGFLGHFIGLVLSNGFSVLCPGYVDQEKWVRKYACCLTTTISTLPRAFGGAFGESGDTP